MLWITRTRVSELQFALTTGARTEPVLLGMPKRQNASAPENSARVRFEHDGTSSAADVGLSVLDIAEKGGHQFEAGCRMGVCGADPVAILDGMSCLSAPERDDCTRYGGWASANRPGWPAAPESRAARSLFR